MREYVVTAWHRRRGIEITWTTRAHDAADALTQWNVERHNEMMFDTTVDKWMPTGGEARHIEPCSSKEGNMKYIVALNVQVIVDAPNGAVAEREAWRLREVLRVSKQAEVTSVRLVREYP